MLLFHWQKRRKIFDPTDSGLKPSKRPRTSYNADDGQYSSSGENDFLDLSIDESRDMESEDNSRSAVGMDSSYLDVSSPVEPVVVKRRQGRPRKDSIVIPKGPGPQKFSPKKVRQSSILKNINSCEPLFIIIFVWWILRL